MKAFHLVPLCVSAFCLGAAPAAFAGTTPAPKAETSNAHTIATAQQATPEVRGAVEDRNLIRVVDAEGNVFFNRLIPAEDLPDPALSVDTVETITVEHEGRTYTNRVVSVQG